VTPPSFRTPIPQIVRREPPGRRPGVARMAHEAPSAAKGKKFYDRFLKNKKIPQTLLNSLAVKRAQTLTIAPAGIEAARGGWEYEGGGGRGATPSLILMPDQLLVTHPAPGQGRTKKNFVFPHIILII
jgi:hypothetical protein